MLVIAAGRSAAGFLQNQRRFGTFERNGAGGCRHVLQFHLVGDDVPPDMLRDFLPQLGFGVEKNMIVAGQQDQVRLDAPLRVKQKRVAAGAGAEFLDVVRGQVVQQPGAVAPTNCNPPARAQIHPRGAAPQSFVTLVHILEDAVQIGCDANHY